MFECSSPRYRANLRTFHERSGNHSRPPIKPRHHRSAPSNTSLVSNHLTGKPSLAYHLSMSDVFEAIAAPARRAILDVLRERDGQTLFEICARLAMAHDMTLTRQAISQHLEVLESAGLLSTKREGRYKYHYLNTAPLETIVQRWLLPKAKGKEK